MFDVESFIANEDFDYKDEKLVFDKRIPKVIVRYEKCRFFDNDSTVFGNLESIGRIINQPVKCEKLL